MDDEQQFCLKWNNHQSTLVSVFDSLLRRNQLLDCTLAAEGRSMKAHKVILSACSPYFESLLADYYDKHPVFILKDVKFKELEAMMDYMYRGEVNVSQDQLGPLLKAAESLQIKGLSDNRRGDSRQNDERRREPPAPQPREKSPPPAPSLPQVKGLVIEQQKKIELNNREGSQSPGRRKKRRRQSIDQDAGNDSSIENHDGASNGSSSVSVSQPIVPPNVPLNDSRSDITSASSIVKTKEENMPQVPQVKQKLEPHSELMLEPKSEYIEEDMNDDSIEDLTLDDDELDMDHSRPGPSHGGQGDGSNQGFGSWQMDPSQDETFMAAQEAVGQHRDAQDINLEDITDGAVDGNWQMVEVVYPEGYSYIQTVATTKTNNKENNGDKKQELNELITTFNNKRTKSVLPCAEYYTNDGYKCPNCARIYTARRNLVRHINLECGKEPKYNCPYCHYKNHRRNELKKHIKNRHNIEIINKVIKL